jgi:hypothetical protein
MLETEAHDALSTLAAAFAREPELESAVRAHWQAREATSFPKT